MSNTVHKTLFTNNKSVELVFTKNIIYVGPELPKRCIGGKMLTSISGFGVILVGCQKSHAIYELKNTNGELFWQEKKQTLQFPRYYATTMLIPDDLTNCTFVP